MSGDVLVVSGTSTGVGKTVVTAALTTRKIICAGLVIGSWPRRPGLAELANLTDLETIAGGPLAGIMPENAGTLGRPEFLAAAFAGLGARLGGRGEARSRSES